MTFGNVSLCCINYACVYSKNWVIFEILLTFSQNVPTKLLFSIFSQFIFLTLLIFVLFSQLLNKQFKLLVNKCTGKGGGAGIISSDVTNSFSFFLSSSSFTTVSTFELFPIFSCVSWKYDCLYGISWNSLLLSVLAEFASFN